MVNAIRYRNGEREIVEATADDVPADHEIAVAARRAAMSLTRRQTLIALVDNGFITALEGRASSSSVPASVELAIAGTYETDGEREAARLTWLNFTVAYRLDPMTALLANVPDPALTDEQVDAIFEAYSLI